MFSLIESTFCNSDSKAPWIENRIVTWWQMEQFSAHLFFYTARALASVKMDTIMHPGGRGDEPISSELWMQHIELKTKERALNHFPQIEKCCRGLGLTVVADIVAEAIEHIKADQARNFWLSEKVETISHLVEKELSQRFFLYISPDQAKFWPLAKEPFVFGQAAATAFPSTTWDSVQAGMAVSMRMPTAAVFHLMRVLEFALSALGAVFGVSLAHTNWAPAIEEIESKIRNMHKDPTWKAQADYKEQQEFYSQAASSFWMFKDAWRNYTMHARGKYTEEESETIFRNIKAFMQKLSERLCEPNES